MTEVTTDVPPCPNHNCHRYKFDELRLSNEKGSNEQPYFRALIFFYKKPGLTDEFFHDHWKSVHADLTIQTRDAGIHLLRYTQFHMEPKHREEIQPLLEASMGTMQLVPWDACAEFHAKSATDFTNFMKNVYTSDNLVGCGKRFADLHQGYQLMCGYDNLIFGAAVPGLGGADGILPGDARLNYSKKEGLHEKKGLAVPSEATALTSDSGSSQAEKPILRKKMSFMDRVKQFARPKAGY